MNYFSNPLDIAKIETELKQHQADQFAKIEALDEALDHLQTFKPEKLDARVASHFDGLADYRKKDPKAPKWQSGEWVDGTSQKIASVSWYLTEYDWVKDKDGNRQAKLAIRPRNQNNDKIELTLDYRTKTDLIEKMHQARAYCETLIDNAKEDIEHLPLIDQHYNKAIEAMQAVNKLIKSHITSNHIAR